MHRLAAISSAASRSARSSSPPRSRSSSSTSATSRSSASGSDRPVDVRLSDSRSRSWWSTAGSRPRDRDRAPARRALALDPRRRRSSPGSHSRRSVPYRSTTHCSPRGWSATSSSWSTGCSPSRCRSSCGVPRTSTSCSAGSSCGLRSRRGRAPAVLRRRHLRCLERGLAPAVVPRAPRPGRAVGGRTRARGGGIVARRRETPVPALFSSRSSPGCSA